MAKWDKFVKECTTAYMKKPTPAYYKQLVDHIEKCVGPKDATMAKNMFDQQLKATPSMVASQVASRVSSVAPSHAAASSVITKQKLAESVVTKRKADESTIVFQKPKAPPKKRKADPKPPYNPSLVGDAVGNEYDDDDDEVLDFGDSEDDVEETEEDEEEKDDDDDQSVMVDNDEYLTAFENGKITADEYAEFVKEKQEESRYNREMKSVYNQIRNDEEEEFLQTQIKHMKKLLESKRATYVAITTEMQKEGLSKRRVKELETWSKRLKKEIQTLEFETSPFAK
jgi:hypothetical protein